MPSTAHIYSLCSCSVHPDMPSPGLSSTLSSLDALTPRLLDPEPCCMPYSSF